MTLLRGLARELFGLFVDDGVLALGILFAVMLAAMITAVLPQQTPLAGMLLLIACLALLFVSAARARR